MTFATDLKELMPIMAVDRFALCPGGTGKKIKFCGNECVSFIDKVTSFLSAQQYRQALQLVNTTLARNPNQACAWSYKCLLERFEGNVAAIIQAAEEFFNRFPRNPVALAEKAIACTAQLNFDQAIECLGDSLEITREHKLDYHDYQISATHIVSNALDIEGYTASQVELLYRMIQCTKEYENRELSELYVESIGNQAVPVELREIQWDGYVPADKDVNQAEEPWDRADQLREMLHWAKMEQEITAYLDQHPDHARLWHYLGVVRLWRMKFQGAREAFVRAADLEPNDRLAVFSAVRAGLVDPEIWEDYEATCRLCLDLQGDEPERVKEAILSDQRVVVLDKDDIHLAEGVVPPELVFIMLREPISSQQPSGSRFFEDSDQSPLLGMGVYFGRQTDAPASLLFARISQCDAPKLAEIAGDWTSRQTVEWSDPQPDGTRDRFAQTVDDLLMISETDGSVDAVAELRHYLLKWVAKLRRPMWGGVTLQEALQDPHKRRWAIAYLFSHIGQRHGYLKIVDCILEFAQQLGVTFTSDQDFVECIADAPCSLAWMLDIPALSNSALLSLFHHSLLFMCVPIALRLSQEIMRRDEIGAEPKVSACTILVKFTPPSEENYDQLLAWVKESATLAEQANIPHAELHIEEFHLKTIYERQDGTGPVEVVNHLLEKHPDEPEAKEFFAFLLRMSPQFKAMREAQDQPVGNENVLWTPGSSPHFGREGEKSGGDRKIWIPGSE